MSQEEMSGKGTGTGTGEDSESRQERERSVRATAPPPSPDAEEGEVMNTLFGPSNKEEDGRTAMIPAQVGRELQHHANRHVNGHMQLELRELANSKQRGRRPESRHPGFTHDCFFPLCFCSPACRKTNTPTSTSWIVSCVPLTSICLEGGTRAELIIPDLSYSSPNLASLRTQPTSFRRSMLFHSSERSLQEALYPSPQRSGWKRVSPPQQLRRR